jgi:hypothetical protein
MAKRLSYEEKKEKLLVDIINKMFEIAGHNVTFDDIKDRKDDWYNQWTMTEEQYEQWRKWGSKQIKKLTKLTDVYADRQMAMIGLNYGLKFDKPNTYNEKAEV